MLDSLFSWDAPLATRILFVFGIAFFVANVKLIVDLILHQLRRRSALVVWNPPPPPYHGLNLALGVACGLLVAIKVFWLKRPLGQLFGEGMMFVYYGYAYPLSTRIARGFYQDGIWTQGGFVRWNRISALSWKESSGAVTLILISRSWTTPKKLVIPGHLYGEARRVLLDRIKAHDIQIGGTGLDLGSRQETDGI